MDDLLTQILASGGNDPQMALLQQMLDGAASGRRRPLPGRRLAISSEGDGGSGAIKAGCRGE